MSHAFADKHTFFQRDINRQPQSPRIHLPSHPRSLSIPVPSPRPNLTHQPSSPACVCTSSDLRTRQPHSTPSLPSMDKYSPFLDMRVLSRVPLPPSQNPVPRFAVRGAWHTPQSSGR
jgi:hypothetical protein